MNNVKDESCDSRAEELSNALHDADAAITDCSATDCEEAEDAIFTAEIDEWGNVKLFCRGQEILDTYWDSEGECKHDAVEAIRAANAIAKTLRILNQF